MLLAVDVGNTQTVFGLFDGASLTEHWRIATEPNRSGDELSVLYRGFLDLGRVDGIVLSSTVPQLSRSYQEFAGRYTDVELLELGPGVKTGIPVRYDDPREVGPDRIANAVAAADRYGAPCIVVDFGTSTNFDVVSPEGEYVGGVLAPGIEVSMDALFERAARLRKVDFVEPPTVIGKTTVAALQSGVVYGFAGQVDGIVKAIRGELGTPARAIATGGLADLIAPMLARSSSSTRSSPSKGFGSSGSATAEQVSGARRSLERKNWPDDGSARPGVGRGTRRCGQRDDASPGNRGHPRNAWPARSGLCEPRAPNGRASTHAGTGGRAHCRIAAIRARRSLSSGMRSPPRTTRASCCR